MLELLQDALTSQYVASLSMLEDVLRSCPDDQWTESVGSNPFWLIAYHALFYTDLYLSRDEDSFEPQEYCRENWHFLDRLPFPPYTKIEAEPPLDRETLLEYVDHCRGKVPESVNSETIESLEGACGFWWYKIPRGEFHLNNIRHLQHHTAQLISHLRRTADIGIGWNGGAANKWPG